jgi:integrase
MYTMAVEWGYVKASPAKSVKKFKEPPGRLRYLKPDEVNTLLAQCSEHLRRLVVTAINTGMRRGELFNLKWPQVDLTNRKITVVNTKNNESRVIPVNQTLYDELFSLSRKPQGEYVFYSRYGRPFKDAKEGFVAAVKRAGIGDFRFHDLRHTFASHLVMQGVGLRTVQQVMGHKDIKMTMRYSHLSPEYVQEAMERLDSVWTLFGHQGQNADFVKAHKPA